MKRSIVTSLYLRGTEDALIFQRLFLDSVLKYGDKDTELVLVNDSSPIPPKAILDRVKPALKRKLAGFQYLENTRNLGYAASNNKGVRAAKGKIVILMNQDTRLSKGALNSMAGKLLANKGFAIIGPWTNSPASGASRIFFKDLKNYSNDAIENIDEFAREIRAGSKGGLKEIKSTYAFCWVMKKDTFNELGGFDERFYPTYWEDVDFFIRAKEAGYKLGLDTSTFIFHGQVGSNNYWNIFRKYAKPCFFKNMYKFCRKYGRNGINYLVREIINWQVGLFVNRFKKP